MKKKQKEELDILTYATPLRSSNISRCGSVEVISDVELTSSESIQSCKVNLKRRRDPASGTPHRQRQKTLATIAFRSALLSFDEFADNGMDQIEWLKCHATTSDGILVVSNGTSYMIEHKLHLDSAHIREVRYKGRGIIKLTLDDYRKVMLIRFRDRFERRQWLQCLDDQSKLKHTTQIDDDLTKDGYYYQPSPSKCRKSTYPTLHEDQEQLHSTLTPASKRRRSVANMVNQVMSRIKSKTVLSKLKKRVSLG